MADSESAEAEKAKWDWDWDAQGSRRAQSASPSASPSLLSFPPFLPQLNMAKSVLTLTVLLILSILTPSFTSSSPTTDQSIRHLEFVPSVASSSIATLYAAATSSQPKPSESHDHTDPDESALLRHESQPAHEARHHTRRTKLIDFDPTRQHLHRHRHEAPQRQSNPNEPHSVHALITDTAAQGSSSSSACHSFPSSYQSFPTVVLTHGRAKGTQAEILLYGATVIRWETLDEDSSSPRSHVWLSPLNQLSPGSTVRGGIPIVFPQFGSGALPPHGFARIANWTLTEVWCQPVTGDVLAELTLEDDEGTRATAFPYQFQLVLTVRLSATKLHYHILVRNLEDEKAFNFAFLVHNYLTVPNITSTVVEGLFERQYMDKADKFKMKTEEEKEGVRFDGVQLVDRVYANASRKGHEVVVEDEHCSSSASASSSSSCHRDKVVTVSTPRGFHDFVVWNPGSAIVDQFGDIGMENYQHFVCVESGYVSQLFHLGPGRSWEGEQELKLPN